MKKIDLGQTIQVLGNIAVVVGILLLIYELSLNRQMMRAQTRTAVSEGLTSYLTAIGANAQVASVVFRGNAGGEEAFGDVLSDAEGGQYIYLQQAMFSYFENVHYQYRNDLYDESEFNAQRNAWRRLFALKGVAEGWCRTRHERSPEFVGEIDGLLTTYKCD